MKISTLASLAACALMAVACSAPTQNDKAMNRNEECLICGSPLEYLEQDTVMECVLCHRREPSKMRCTEGHYVCSDCHTQSMDSIIAMCLDETSKNPIAIFVDYIIKK